MAAMPERLVWSLRSHVSYFISAFNELIQVLPVLAMSAGLQTFA